MIHRSVLSGFNKQNKKENVHLKKVGYKDWTENEKTFRKLEEILLKTTWKNEKVWLLGSKM